jgi:hypothetical protein
MPRLFTYLMMGLLLLAAGERAHAGEAEATVAKKAAILELMHSKARKALVTAAQDARYRDYFTSSSAAEQIRLKEHIDGISLEVQSHFHVEEMCLIDPNGAEISRIVGSAIAHDLDLGESDNVFFRPGFALKPRTVYVSPIYISGDAHKWVVAYVTPIVVAGETRAILHYEHGLAVYQDALNKGMSGADEFIVAVHPDGWVISDSRVPVGIAARGALESPADYFTPFAWGGMTVQELKSRLGGGPSGAAAVAVDGKAYDVAYQTVEQWTLVVVAVR